MATEFMQRLVPPGAEVPRHITEALDQSEDDLRHGRVEDARAFLDQMQAQIDEYKARKQDRMVVVGPKR